MSFPEFYVEILMTDETKASKINLFVHSGNIGVIFIANHLSVSRLQFLLLTISVLADYNIHSTGYY